LRDSLETHTITEAQRLRKHQVVRLMQYLYHPFEIIEQAERYEHLVSQELKDPGLPMLHHHRKLS